MTNRNLLFVFLAALVAALPLTVPLSIGLAAALVAGDLPAAFTAMHNTLEPPARALAADVGRLLDAMTAAGAVRPMLTGSGSACFALARSEPEARATAARLEAAGWPRVFAVQVVSAAAG
jgi:4-diphosphocytidyl-2-C-methyl-D-erythritol kinase